MVFYFWLLSMNSIRNQQMMVSSIFDYYWLYLWSDYNVLPLVYGLWNQFIKHYYNTITVCQGFSSTVYDHKTQALFAFYSCRSCCSSSRICKWAWKLWLLLRIIWKASLDICSPYFSWFCSFDRMSQRDYLGLEGCWYPLVIFCPWLLVLSLYWS